jgi:hypothetical protein
MNRYPFLAAVVVCWAVAVLDCGGESGPLLQIVRQASPTAFKGMITLQVKPIDFTNLRVGEKTEAQWLADKDPDAQASQSGDERGFHRENHRDGGRAEHARSGRTWRAARHPTASALARAWLLGHRMG